MVKIHKYIFISKYIYCKFFLLTLVNSQRPYKRDLKLSTQLWQLNLYVSYSLLVGLRYGAVQSESFRQRLDEHGSARPASALRQSASAHRHYTTHRLRLPPRENFIKKPVVQKWQCEWAIFVKRNLIETIELRPLLFRQILFFFPQYCTTSLVSYFLHLGTLFNNSIVKFSRYFDGYLLFLWHCTKWAKKVSGTLES